MKRFGHGIAHFCLTIHVPQLSIRPRNVKEVETFRAWLETPIRAARGQCAAPKNLLAAGLGAGTREDEMNFKPGEIARLAMTLAVAIALAGLAGSATAETVTLKVWSLKTVGQTGWEDFFNNAIAEYKTTHPDVDVVAQQRRT